MTSTNETDHAPDPRKLEALAPDWGWKRMAVLAVLMLVGGALAFMNPFAASLTVEIVAGFAFVVVGLTQLWLAFSERGKDRRARALTGVLGLALVVLAIALLANPLAGLVTLTITVAVMFAVMGTLRIAMALAERPNRGWGWILAAGVMSLALAALIVIGLPGSAAGILGILLGIDLIMSGAVTAGLAMQLYRQEGERD